jgi:hypothetical protein
VKLLFSSQSAPDVGLLKNLLEDSGIATELRNEGVNAAFPGAAFQAEVWILNDQDFTKACEIRDAWHQAAPVRDPLAEESESRGALWLIGIVCFGGGVVTAYWGFRAQSWAHFLVTGFLFSMVAIIYNVMRHLPSPKRIRKPTNP